MIISVEEVKKYIKTTVDDSVLEEKLHALELLVRKYTNNNFQHRGIRVKADCDTGGIIGDVTYFQLGDTIEVSESKLNSGVYEVLGKIPGQLLLDAELFKESGVLVTKVSYPSDIKMGVANMLKWDLENRDKVGIQSETISRHSVTYFNMDGENSIMGYPRSLLGFLTPYKKARF